MDNGDGLMGAEGNKNIFFQLLVCEIQMYVKSEREGEDKIRHVSLVLLFFLEWNSFFCLI